MNVEIKHELLTQIALALLGDASDIPEISEEMSFTDFCSGCADIFVSNSCKRLFRRDSQKYCVYWIRLPQHTDITKEGYIGITNNFEVRMKQHAQKSNKNKSVQQNIKNSIATVLVIGYRSYCREVESKLRPFSYIGWNKAIGGDGGVTKHGLSKSKAERTFYKLKRKATKLNKNFLPEYKACADALRAFYSLYESLKYKSGVFTFKNTDDMVLNLKDIEKISKTEIQSRRNRKYDLDGNFFTAIELANMYGVSTGSISYRVSKGWKPEEVVKWLKNR